MMKHLKTRVFVALAIVAIALGINFQSLAGIVSTPGQNGNTNTISVASATFGDVKFGYQPNNHQGWVKLVGQSSSALSPTQLSVANSLGIISGGLLPDISNRTIIGAGLNPLNGIGGASTVILAQANLPNITLTSTAVSAGTPAGSIDTQGAHTHPYNIPYASNARFDSNQNGGSSFGSNTGYTTGSAGSHSHNFSGIPMIGHTHTVALGGSSTALSTQNPFIALNGFIYLGA